MNRRLFKRLLRSSLCASCLLLPWAGSSALGQTLSTWNGGSGAWENSGNWSPNGSPNSTNADVVIGGPGSIVTLSSDANIGRASIASGASLLVGFNDWLTLNNFGFAGSGVLQVDGTVSLSSSSMIRLWGASPSSFSFQGGGTLDLGTGQISHISGPHTLTNGITITGSGSIDSNLVNNGIISATGAGGILLNGSSFTNNGQIVANASSKIRFNSGSYYNSGHTMSADGAGAQLHFTNSGSIQGGTLQGINGGEVLIHSDNAILDGQTNGPLTLLGNIRIEPNFWPYFRGQINNNGSITTGNDSWIRIASGDTATFDSTNGGQIQLNGASIRGAGNLVNGAGHTIVGSGSILTNATNNGIIRAQGGLLQMQASFTNNGQMVASAGSELQITGTVTNNSSISANGAGSKLHMFAGSVQGGTLQGINGGEVLVDSDNFVLDGQTNGTLHLAGNIQVANNTWPYMRGTIDNAGQITLGPTSQLRLAAGDSATIGSSSLSGQIVLNNSQIRGFGGGAQFTNGYGNTIRGSGEIGQGTIDLVNQGRILAETGQTIQISPANNFTNSAWLSSLVHADGGTINFTSGNITNPWGEFRASNGGSINLVGSSILTDYSSGTLTGGYYTVEGTGQLNLGIGIVTTLNNAGVTLSGATSTFSPIQSLAINNAGYFEIDGGRNFTTVGGYSADNSAHTVVGNGSTLTISGALNQSGGMTVLAGGNLLATAGPLAQYNSTTHALTGGEWHVGGTMRLATGAINELSGGGLYLTSNVAQILQSDGSNALSGFNRVNSGSTFGIGDGVSFTGPSSMENSGTVKIGDGFGSATLSVPGSYTQLSGTTILNGGNLIASGGVSIDGGVLAGHGTLDVGVGGAVTVDGKIDAWQHHIFDLTDTIAIVGDLRLGSNAIYSWSLGSQTDNLTGISGSDWDLLQVSGNVLVNGSTLDFGSWALGQTPNMDVAFWHTNHSWDIMTGNTINNGFHLSQSDFAYGSFSLDVVSSGGGQLLQLNYGISAVPEPTSLALVGLAAIGITFRRTRNKGS